MALLQQAIGGEKTAKLAVEANPIAAHALDKTVHHHQGNRQRCEALDELLIGIDLMRRHQHQAVHAAIDQQTYDLFLMFRGHIGIHDEEGIPPLATPDLQISGERGEEPALDIGDDQAERPGLLHNQATGDLVGDIAFARRDLFDPLAVFFGNAARAVVENERHGRRGNPTSWAISLSVTLAAILPSRKKDGRRAHADARCNIAAHTRNLGQRLYH